MAQSVQQQVPDPYGNYYQPYVQFPAGMLPNAGGGVWSSDPSAGMSYGSTYGSDPYMQYGTGMSGQYDYSTFSYVTNGMDYGGATWGQGVMPMPQSKSMRDYASNGYYDGSDGVAPVGCVAGGVDGNGGYAPTEAELNGSIQSVEHGFKTMRMSSGDDVEDVGNMVSSSNNGGSSGSAGGSVSAHHGASASSGTPSSSQKKSWANIASQPAKTILARPKPPSGLSQPMAQLSTSVVRATAPAWVGSNGRGFGAQGDAGFTRSAGKDNSQDGNTAAHASVSVAGTNINPKDFDLVAKNARFFVIKSFSEDDIHRSIKFAIWCSTEYGNKRLDSAWHESDGKGPVYLLFSVNGSGHFCGMAQMTSPVDYHSTSTVWAQDKWKGVFDVKWIFVKDVPNSQLRHIKLENNEGKPVTNSRDTQEVPVDKGRQVLRIIAQYRHTTSIFDDFGHYEKQLEEGSTNNGSAAVNVASGGSSNGSAGNKQNNKRFVLTFLMSP